jgi:hypothetical protein
MKTKIALLTSIIVLAVFVFTACNKTSHTRTLNEIQTTGVQSVAEYQYLRSVTPQLQSTDLSDNLIFANSKIVGIKESAELSLKLSFEQFYATLQAITGNHPLSFDVNTPKKMPYPEMYIQAKELENTTKVKTYRIPDCKINPKICPCVDYQYEAYCIELPS